MSTVAHVPNIVPCPHLPEVDEPLRAASMKKFGDDRGKEFYCAALACAQSLWMQGLPAQSILLLNRAFGADHFSDLSMCDRWPLPYAAMSWVMRNRSEDQFIGNPRRHFQHLATRMVEPRKQIRTWRAWACWYLSCQIFPDYPADEKQIAEEKISEPAFEEIRAELQENGIPGEAELWETVAKQL